jgi:predicted HD superfamily hydrolase involved in NAD metabolism
MTDRSSLHELKQGLEFGDDLRANMVAFLLAHDCAATAGHSIQVAAEAKRLASVFGLDQRLAEIAGWLHDSSAVIPNERRVQVAEENGIEILAAERILPMIVHQKLSAKIAEELFGVYEQAALSAIGCHTTLKANATALDKAVFVADKIKWDQAGSPPYLASIIAALAISLDQAAFCYLDYLFQNKERLRVLHPWALDAHRELRALVSVKSTSQIEQSGSRTNTQTEQGYEL